MRGIESRCDRLASLAGCVGCVELHPQAVEEQKGGCRLVKRWWMAPYVWPAIYNQSSCEPSVQLSSFRCDFPFHPVPNWWSFQFRNRFAFQVPWG